MPEPSSHHSSDLAGALSASPAALKAYGRILDSHYAEIQADIQGIVDHLPSSRAIAAVTTPVLQEVAMLEQRRGMFRKALQEGDWGPFNAYASGIGEQFAKRGMTFPEYALLIHNMRGGISQIVARELAGKPEELALALQGLDLYLSVSLAHVGASYLQAKQDIIRAQQAAIRELSTPVLQVHDRLLILPLIGTLDSHRAQEAMVDMLEAIRKTRALYLIIDVTGVPLVDSAVALHFTRSAEAARLMGAAIYISGISTAMAQAMVQLGVDLNALATFATLQAGLEMAEGLLGKH